MQNVNLSVLFLANQMLPWIIMAAAIVLILIVAVIFCLRHKQNTEKTIADANEQARRIVDNAEHEADRLRAQGKEDSKRALKEALLEAKEQDLKLRNEFERETKEKKAEIQRMEQRLTQKEDSLDKKLEALILKKQGELEEVNAEIKALKEEGLYPEKLWEM